MGRKLLKRAVCAGLHLNKIACCLLELLWSLPTAGLHSCGIPSPGLFFSPKEFFCGGTNLSSNVLPKNELLEITAAVFREVSKCEL